MKKKVLFGLAAGIAAGTALATMVGKITKEMKSDAVTEEFDSPFGNNWITISIASSDTAKGLTSIKIHAETDANEDSCSLVILAKKDAAISYEWTDNEHFRLLVGNGKFKQCCDIAFDTENITMNYYPTKN